MKRTNYVLSWNFERVFLPTSGSKKSSKLDNSAMSLIRRTIGQMAH